MRERVDAQHGAEGHNRLCRDHLGGWLPGLQQGFGLPVKELRPRDLQEAERGGAADAAGSEQG